MGEMFEHLKEHDDEFHMNTYARKDVLFVSGKGMRLYDDDGREYLDFMSGIGAVNLGHTHPAVVAAVQEQVAKLTHVSNVFHVEHRAELAGDLVTLAGDGFKVHFANSGTEACEAAIKLARKRSKERKGDDAYEIVTALRGFHGRTMGSLAATPQPAKQDPFAPMLPGFTYVPLNDIEALEAAVGPNTAAVMLEPIQGEGGVYPCTSEYLEAARALCDAHDAALVLDEVQTGFFRTGPAFAHQAYGVRPDLMPLAKAMANGLPIGALLAYEGFSEYFSPGDHGSTFAGGPVICAAGCATIHALACEGLGENAIEVGAYLRDALIDLGERTGAITEVRGAGLMVAAQLAEPIAGDIADAALTKGLVLNNVGENILRFLPPLVCGTTEIDTLCAVLYELFDGEE